MPVSPHDIPAALAPIVVPETFSQGGPVYYAISGIPRPHPRPVALDDLPDRAQGNLAGFDGSPGRGSACFAIGGSMFHSKPIKCPHGKITRAPSGVAAGLGFLRPIGIPAVRGTVECFRSRHIFIERPVRFALRVVHDGRGPDIGPDKTTHSAPIRMDRIPIRIIIGIHMVANILLLLVGNALGGLGLDPRPGKRGQQ